MNDSNKAFTLIELIVVMAIIAILVLLAAPRFLGYTKDANVAAMEQDVKVLSDAVEMYHIKEGEWPKSERIGSLGIGGVDELYQLDKNKLDVSIKNISGDYNDYGLAVGGNYNGQVFHLGGVRDKENTLKYGNKIAISQKMNDSLTVRYNFSQENIDLDNNSVLDLSGSGNDGELIGFHNNPNDPITNEGLAFDGVDDIVYVMESGDINENTEFTWDIRAKIDQKAHERAIIIGNRRPDINGGLNFIKVTQISFEQNSPLIHYQIPRGRWITISVVKKENKYRYYVDGKQVSAANARTENMVNFKISLGGDITTNIENAKMVVKHLNIFDKALTNDEILQLYKNNK